MSKEAWEDDYEMESEYDFSDGVRAPYASLAGDLHVVTLDADVRAAFPDSQSVNEALRVLIKAAKNVEDLPEASFDLEDLGEVALRSGALNEIPKLVTVGYPDFWDKARALDPQFFEQAADVTPYLEKCFSGEETEPLAKTCRSIARMVCNSLNGVIILSLNGHGFDARRIARSMFEGAVTVAYLAKYPHELDDYLNYVKVSAKRLLDDSREFPSSSGSGFDPAVAKKIEQNYEGVKGQYEKNGTIRQSWCRKQARQMFADVGLAPWYSSFYHLASAAVHMNARGMYMTYQMDAEKNIRFCVPPDEEWVAKSLAASRAAVITVLNAYSSITKEDVTQKLLQQAVSRFSVAAPENK